MVDNKRLLRVFLCHASGDKPIVRKLYERLTEDGVDAWLDKEKLIPGQNWQIEIPNAVKKSDVVIVCLSSQSTTKEGFVQKEIRFALDVAEEKPDGTIFIIPARLEECNVPERISKYQWVDLFSDDGYSWLIKALQIRASSIGLAVTPHNNFSSWSTIKNPFNRSNPSKPVYVTERKTEFTSSSKSVAGASISPTKSVLVKPDKYWYITGEILSVEAILFGITYPDIGVPVNILGLIPLSTFLLSYFKPVSWGYSVIFVMLLHGIALLGFFLNFGIPDDTPIAIIVCIANALICAGTSFLRLQKR